jgi:hypothetical protein
MSPPVRRVLEPESVEAVLNMQSSAHGNAHNESIWHQWISAGQEQARPARRDSGGRHGPTVNPHG